MIAWAYRCIGEDEPTAAALGRATEVGIREVMPEFRGDLAPLFGDRDAK